MSNEIENTAVEACRKALETCPHDEGTVHVMCKVCLGTGSVFAWDVFQDMFLVVDCTRCTGESRSGSVEVCPCLERFSKETIEQVIRNQDEAEDEDEEPHPLTKALKWTRSGGDSRIPVEAASAAEQLANLRTWAEEHQEIRIPNSKAALILHLLDLRMIEFATVPETGKVVLHAKGAKEEFGWFIAKLNRSYAHDEVTIGELLSFAYGDVDWEFDPRRLQQYERGREIIEICTDGYDVGVHCGGLRGEPKEIEAILLRVFGC